MEEKGWKSREGNQSWNRGWRGDQCVCVGLQCPVKRETDEYHPFSTDVVSFHDESRHLIDVQAMHEAIYRHPFTMPVVPTSNLELPTKQVEHVKQRPISSECIRVTPAQQLARSTELPSLAVVEASQTESGCVASSLTSVMDRSRGVVSLAWLRAKSAVMPRLTTSAIISYGTRSNSPGNCSLWKHSPGI